MVLYIIKNLLPLKYRVKTNQSSANKSYIKLRRDNVVEKQQ